MKKIFRINMEIYFRRMREEVLPIYQEEFSKTIEVEYINNDLAFGDDVKIEDFRRKMGKIRDIDILTIYREEAMNKGSILKKNVKFDGRNVSLDYVCVRLLNRICIKIRRLYDEAIVKLVHDGIKESSNKRCLIEEVVFNFSRKKLSNSMNELLGLGANYVFNDIASSYEARKKYEWELYVYLQKYRRFIEKGKTILKEDVGEWLREAIVGCVGENKHKNFYMLVYDMYDSLFVGRKRSKVSAGEELKKLDKLGIVVVEADKSCGICVLDIETLIQADREMVKELGGKRLKSSKAEVEGRIIKEIMKCESSMDSNARKFMDVYYPGRLDGFQDAELPFLKLRPKVHKLSKEELFRRDVSKLKFRPVVDASVCLVKVYSKFVLDYCTMLLGLVDQRILKGTGWISRNGHEVASYFAGLSAQGTLKNVFAVADMTSAYSYVFLKDLLQALELVGLRVGIAEWKRKLAASAAQLVLTNSYVETSVGIYKLGECLPMGLNMSGGALDIVCLLCELVCIGEFEVEEVSGAGLRYAKIVDGGELCNVKKLNCERFLALFEKYWRYRDDTFSSILARDGTDLRNALDFIGCMFLSSLKIKIKLSCVVGSYLDVVFYKKLSGYGYETFVRRKVGYPVTYPRESSNMSHAIMKVIIDGELLRHRRLCSRAEYIKVNNDCLLQELQSRGYSYKIIQRAMKKRILNLEDVYDSTTWLRIGKRKEMEGLVYGAKVVCDNIWGTHRRLAQMLRCALPEGFRYGFLMNGN